MSSTLFPSMNSLATKIATYHLSNNVFIWDSHSSHSLLSHFYPNFKDHLEFQLFFPPTSPIHVRSSFLGHLLTWMPYLVLTLLISVIYNFMQIFILSRARFCSQWLSQSTNSSIFLGPQFDLTAPALDSYSIPCTSVP